jgi:hypothetical protein
VEREDFMENETSGMNGFVEPDLTKGISSKIVFSTLLQRIKIRSDF